MKPEITVKFNKKESIEVDILGRKTNVRGQGIGVQERR